MRALLWRGMLHLGEARLELGPRDCETAGRLGRQAGLDAAVVIATHNLGLVRWISGDLPGALHEMTRAEEYGPQVRSGLRALERARVLLQAGLLAEARENGRSGRTDLRRGTVPGRPGRCTAGHRPRSTWWPGRRHRPGRPPGARPAATPPPGSERGLLGRPGDGGAGRGHRAGGDPTAVGRRVGAPAGAAERADRLAGELIDAGLTEDAREVRLLQAEALLEAGDVDAAERGRRGCGRARRPGLRAPAAAGEGVRAGAVDRDRIAHPGGGRATGAGPGPAVVGVCCRSGAGWTIWPPTRPGSAPRTCSRHPRCTAGPDQTGSADRPADPFAGGHPAVAGTVAGGQHPAGRRPAVRRRGAGPGAEQAADGMYRARMASWPANRIRTWRTRS